jgi:hypothetical protein
MVKYLIEQGLDVDHAGKDDEGDFTYVTAYPRHPMTLLYCVFEHKFSNIPEEYPSILQSMSGNLKIISVHEQIKAESFCWQQALTPCSALSRSTIFSF